MVTMFPHSGLLPAEFSFNGSSVLAKSSDDDVHDVHISHSSINNQTMASLDLSLDSQGLPQLFGIIFVVNENIFLLENEERKLTTMSIYALYGDFFIFVCFLYVRISSVFVCRFIVL